MKTILALSILLLLVVTLQAQPAQSIHQEHVIQVTDLYWTYLGRSPDKDGMIFWQYTTDNGSKTLDDLKQAFLVSTEYAKRGSRLHPGLRDYTAGSQFMAVKDLPHQELIEISGKFQGRNLVGTDLPPEYGFAGNTLEIASGDQRIRFWVDYRVAFNQPTITLAFPYLSMMVDAKSLTVTYDPVTGVVTKILIS